MRQFSDNPMRCGLTPIRRGFTVVEMLVVIAVIAILIALVVPALAKARGSSRAVKSAANARSLVQVLHSYANDWKDGLPVFTPGVFYPMYNRDQRFSMPYWQIVNMWTGVVFDILPYNENVDVFLSPGVERRSDIDLLWPTSYHYSMSFVGDPRLWTPGATPDPAFQRGRTLSGTAFPSAKAMLWDQEAGFDRARRYSPSTSDLQTPTPVAMADGAVSMLRPSDATAPVPNVFTPPGASMRLHNTPQGQLGRDY